MEVVGRAVDHHPLAAGDGLAAMGADIRAAGPVGAQQGHKPVQKILHLIQNFPLVLEHDLNALGVHVVFRHAELLLQVAGGQRIRNDGTSGRIGKPGGKRDLLPAAALAQCHGDAIQAAVGNALVHGQAVLLRQFFQCGTNHGVHLSLS